MKNRGPWDGPGNRFERPLFRSGTEGRFSPWLNELDFEQIPKQEAERLHHQAMALAAELGMRPLVAHCRLGLGLLSRRMGRGARAREHLAAAIAMSREMDMRLWLAPAEAAIGGPA